MRRVIRRASPDLTCHMTANTYLVSVDSLTAQRAPPLRLSEIGRVSLLLILGTLAFTLSDVLIFGFPVVGVLAFAAAYMAMHLVLIRVLGIRLLPVLIVNGFLILLALLL